MTGSGSRLARHNKRSREWEMVSDGRWALCFEGGRGWSHGREKPLPAFFQRRALWSRAWRCRDRVCNEGERQAVAGLISGGEQSILNRRRLL